MSVSVTPSGADDLQIGKPQSRFQSPALINADYDVWRNGDFLLNVPIGNATSQPLPVILNWLETLKGR